MMNQNSTSGEKPFENEKFRILTLDGGGAKGFYTIGVLSELEALLEGKLLCTQFDLIYGTSTGAIIASLLAMGKSVADIHELYKKYVPTIMGSHTAKKRTQALEGLATEVYGDLKFDAMKTRVGLVSTRWVEQTPMIFKTNVDQAHAMQATFSPGFGCTIADAVVASCSAYPIFNRKIVVTEDGDHIELLDGGYCANNPTLYAIADAVRALNFKYSQLRVVSIGVGSYPEPAKYWHNWFISKFFLVRLLRKTLGINTHSMEQLSDVLFKDVPIVRINETYNTLDMAADLTERDVAKLNLLYRRGKESFRKHENELKTLFR